MYLSMPMPLVKLKLCLRHSSLSPTLPNMTSTVTFGLGPLPRLRVVTDLSEIESAAPVLYLRLFLQKNLNCSWEIPLDQLYPKITMPGSCLRTSSRTECTNWASYIGVRSLLTCAVTSSVSLSLTASMTSPASSASIAFLTFSWIFGGSGAAFITSTSALRSLRSSFICSLSTFPSLMSALISSSVSSFASIFSILALRLRLSP